MKPRNRLGTLLVQLATKIVTQDHDGWKALYDANTKWTDRLNAENAAWYKDHMVVPPQPEKGDK